MAEEYLVVRSVDAWPRRFAEELTMEPGDEFQILRTSMSGWWYAMNLSTREEGLVPFSKVEIIQGTFADFGDLSWSEYEHIERTVFGWEIDNVTQVIFQKNKMSADEQHMLLHCLRHCIGLVQKTENAQYFLKEGGMDRLAYLLTKSYDIGQRFFILRLLAWLSVNELVKRFPPRSNIASAIVTVMDEYMQFATLVATAADAIANLCYENEGARRQAVSETKAIGIMITSMKMHREKFGVQLSATRAITNLMSDPLAESQFDDEAMRVVVDSLVFVYGFELSLEMADDEAARAYDARLAGGDKTDPMVLGGGASLLSKKGGRSDFAQSVMMLLSATITDARKAKAFTQAGGFTVLRKLYNKAGKENENLRSAIVVLLNRMSQDRIIAKCFLDSHCEGLDLVYYYLSVSEETSLFFYQCFHLLSFLLSQFEAKRVIDPLLRGFDVDRYNLADSMQRALRMTENIRLLESAASMMALCCRTKDERLMQLLIDTKICLEFIPLGISGGLMGMPDPSKMRKIDDASAVIASHKLELSHTFLNYCFMAFYNIADKSYENANILYESGVLRMCLGNVDARNVWFKDPYVPADCLRNGSVVIINVLKHLHHRLPKHEEQDCAKFLGYLEGANEEGDLTDLIKYLKKALDRQAKLHPKGSKEAKKQEAIMKREAKAKREAGGGSGAAAGGGKRGGRGDDYKDDADERRPKKKRAAADDDDPDPVREAEKADRIAAYKKRILEEEAAKKAAEREERDDQKKKDCLIM